MQGMQGSKRKKKKGERERGGVVKIKFLSEALHSLHPSSPQAAISVSAEIAISVRDIDRDSGRTRGI